MDPRETARYLDSFVNYEKRATYPYKRSFRLERIGSFLAAIGDPQDAFKSVHVAGTKGKGSVCLFCANILRSAGLRVGLYTSPHLCDVRERIRILEPGSRPADFEGMIGREELARLVAGLKPSIERFCASSPYGPLSFFEVYTALAFVYFRSKKVDCAVLETGLGGRLDATNVVVPAACCITSISLDHTQKLGRTLAAIAREKAGIIKPRIPVVSAPQKAGALRVIEKICYARRSRLCLIGRDRSLKDLEGIPIPLRGAHQSVNAACAAALCAAAAPALGVKLERTAVAQGLAGTRWPGRFEAAGRFVLDGAHNGDSARALCRTLTESYPGKKITFILGVSKDKDLGAICRQLVRVSDRFIVTAADNPRAALPKRLAERIRAAAPGVRVRISQDIDSALEMAEDEGKERVCCVTGSIFLVGEARQRLKDRYGR